MFSWSDQMSHMLAAFDHQAKYSLSNIKMEFNRNGQSLNADFKRYFLRVSYDRIKLTYDQFEMNAIFQEQIDLGSNASTSTIDETQMVNLIQTKGPVEIIDSADEEDYHTKCEPYSDTTSVFSYDNTETNHELNDFVRNDCQKDVSQSNEAETDKSTKAEEMEMNDGISNIAEAVATKPSKYPIKMMERSSDLLYSEPRQSLPSTDLEMKKRHKCQFCAYSSNQIGHLNRHMRTHTGDKPYRCDICRKGFTTMQSLKKHEVTHIEQIPFHCRGCFKGFSEETERDDHEKVCKLRRYECHICKKYVNVNKNQLEKHMRTHNGGKPFRCEICMKRFTQKIHLKKHLDTVHNGNNL